MALNTAYLKARSTPASDECLTPRYGVLPIVKHLKARGYKRIWCPFDQHHSFYVRVLQAEGFDVVYGHIEDGKDFFDQPLPDGIDCVVSNPPFSLKDKILARCYGLCVPFALLLPQNSLQSIERVNLYIKYGIEYLGFDRRVNFYTRGDLSAWKPANHFACGYFCHNVLPLPLQFERLEPVQEPYHSD